jgi:hypothetical protein
MRRKLEIIRDQLLTNKSREQILAHIDPSQIEFFLENYLTTDEIRLFFKDYYVRSNPPLNREQLIQIVSKNFIYS